MDLKDALHRERLASYVRLRGGYSVPLAGAVYWLALSWLGTQTGNVSSWAMLAFIASGTIFPLALGFATLFRNPFMKDRTAVTSVLFAAFASMLLFWPMAIAALWHAPQLVPLILAIGLSIHWPVIGWSYGRPVPYIAHAWLRSLGAFAIWQWMPQHRLDLLPLWVAIVYLLTVAIIWFDSGRMKKQHAAIA